MLKMRSTQMKCLAHAFQVLAGALPYVVLGRYERPEELRRHLPWVEESQESCPAWSLEGIGFAVMR